MKPPSLGKTSQQPPYPHRPVRFDVEHDQRFSSDWQLMLELARAKDDARLAEVADRIVALALKWRLWGVPSSWALIETARLVTS
jgi:hypothetical protein